MTTDQPESGGGALLLWAALVVAVAALAGSLYLSIGMSLKACPLCLYQRTFVMAAAGVLGLGVLVRQRGNLLVLALPAVGAGLGVAIFHEYLETTGKLECPGGIFGVGTAPQQSLAILAVLFAVVLIGAARNESGWSAVLAALVLGGLFAWGSIKSAPPMPPPPALPYKTENIDICRPPYVGGTQAHVLGDSQSCSPWRLQLDNI